MGQGVGVVFPRAVDLVADLPIAVVVTLGDIGVSHPVGGLRRGAGAVVGGDDHVGRPGGGGELGETVEAGHPGPRVAVALVGRPMVAVGIAAAGIAQGPQPHLGQQRGGRGGVQVAVPHRCVDAENPRIGGAEGGGGVDGDGDAGGGGGRDQPQIVHIERALGGRRSALDPETGEIGAVERAAEGGKRDSHLLPGVRKGRRESHGARRGFVAAADGHAAAHNLERLAAGGAAVDPKAHAGVGGRIEPGAMDRQRAKARGGGDRQGGASAVDKGARAGRCGIEAPVLPAIHQRIRIDQEVRLGDRLRPRRRCEQQRGQTGKVTANRGHKGG